MNAADVPDGEGRALRTVMRAELQALADPAYREFSLSLTPGASGLLGVRLPELRRMARALARGEEWRSYLNELSTDALFEEKMLAGFALGMARDVSWEDRLEAIARFVPFIDNWAVCDAFCSSQAWVKSDRDGFWPVLARYAVSPEPFSARFALVMALKYYAVPPWTASTLRLATSLRREECYVRMAAAWAVAECCAHDPDAVEAALREGRLDVWTHNKAIQKIAESRRVGAAVKARLRALKRK